VGKWDAISTVFALAVRLISVILIGLTVVALFWTYALPFLREHYGSGDDWRDFLIVCLLFIAFDLIHIQRVQKRAEATGKDFRSRIDKLEETQEDLASQIDELRECVREVRELHEATSKKAQNALGAILEIAPEFVDVQHRLEDVEGELENLAQPSSPVDPTASV